MRDPRTFYEFLLRKKVEANKRLKFCVQKIKDTNGDYDAKQEFYSEQEKYRLIVHILHSYRAFRNVNKVN